jgi:hypothetical protein
VTRRRPNPWIALPALVLGLLGAGLGWLVTDVSCRQPDSNGLTAGCTGWALLVAVVAFVTVAIGVTLILALVFRSIAEWRQAVDRTRGGGRRP